MPLPSLPAAGRNKELKLSNGVYEKLLSARQSFRLFLERFFRKVVGGEESFVLLMGLILFIERKFDRRKGVGF